MAFDAYLHIDGIKGESTDSQHKDWIEVLSYSPSTSQPAPTAAASSGKVQMQDFHFVKKVDNASPKLYLAASSGKHIPEVTIELMRASGGSKLKYMTIKLNEVTITSVSPAAHSGTTPLPSPPLASLTNAAATTPALMTESVTFNYGSIQRTYTQQKRPDGSSGGNTSGKWSHSQGTAA